jgi:hypothetical protein
MIVSRPCAYCEREELSPEVQNFLVVGVWNPPSYARFYVHLYLMIHIYMEVGVTKESEYN